LGQQQFWQQGQGAPVGLQAAFCMSSQMASAASQRPPSEAARMAAV
jgi:hypothetical protein